MDFIGTNGNDVLTGGLDDDKLYGGKGNDTLDGGAHGLYGDTVDYATAAGPVSVNLGAGTATDDFGGIDTLLNIENIDGGDFGDVLVGNSGDNRISPAAGDDTVNGGAGFDAVTYKGSAGAVVVNLMTGVASGTSIGSDALTGIEAVVGSDFNDTLSGSDSGVLESFEGRGGNDTIDGKGGIDRASYDSSPAAVSVNLGAGTASDGWGGTDALQNIENVGGSAFNDTLAGGSGNNLLTGGAGDDSITGGDGNDTLDGGAGNDTLDGGAGNDTALFTSNVAAYTISADFVTRQVIVNGADGVDLLINIELLQFADFDYRVVLGSAQAETIAGSAEGDLIQGGGGNDDISGGGGDDFMDGGTGDDNMTGGTGDDTYLVDSVGDRVTEVGDSSGAAPEDGQLADNLGAGIDKVVASINYTLGSFVENLTLAGGNATLTGTGNSLNNAIAGNAGDNVLAGQGGNDQIDGGAGRDTAAYAGQLGQYSVSGGPLGFTVNGQTANEGTDTINQVERLKFADVNLALDLDGNAGMVAKILGAVFGSSSVSQANYVGAGLGYSDSGLTYEALMQLALDYRLGAGASHSAVVELLYLNVVGSAPDAATAGYYTGLLNNGTYTPAGLGVLAADTSFNTTNINLTGLTQTGLTYT